MFTLKTDFLKNIASTVNETFNASQSIDNIKTNRCNDELLINVG